MADAAPTPPTDAELAVIWREAVSAANDGPYTLAGMQALYAAGRASVAEPKRDELENAFKAGWQASGEGWNGEYPDEGVPWDKSGGYSEWLKWLASNG